MLREIESLGALVTRILGHLDGGDLGGGFEEPIRRGSASGSVAVVSDPDDPGRKLLRVSLTIMKVPIPRATEFYRRLLELNRTFQGRAAFSVNQADIVSLTAAQPAANLDPSDIIDLVLWTSERADDLDDVLLEEFGYEHSL